MKKFMSAVALCGAMLLTGCDGNAGAQNGDTVVIDFAGYKDGVAFAGGTATNFPLVLVLVNKPVNKNPAPTIHEVVRHMHMQPATVWPQVMRTETKIGKF